MVTKLIETKIETLYLKGSFWCFGDFQKGKWSFPSPIPSTVQVTYKKQQTPQLWMKGGGGGGWGIWIALFSEVTLFEDSVSTILFLIVTCWLIHFHIFYTLRYFYIELIYSYQISYFMLCCPWFLGPGGMRNERRAAKVALMKIKMKAIGDPSVPQVCEISLLSKSIKGFTLRSFYNTTPRNTEKLIPVIFQWLAVVDITLLWTSLNRDFDESYIVLTSRVFLSQRWIQTELCLLFMNLRPPSS